MTNRSKSAKKPRLRFLDLSFDENEDGKWGGLDNGKRPHGGYRGCKKHPPTPYAQDKNRDYHRKLREDIDRLFEEEFLEVHGTPSWTLEANKEITHSGESPLFLHKFMSPSRDGSRYIRLSKSAVSNPNKCQPPLSRDGVTYYRPNRTHQYLTATELKNQSENEVNLKYGRPTRTTLLRARQRTNSAPVNSYEIRRENMKREEELRNSSVYTNPKEFLQEVYASTNGETFHSFITGARYNRAHCIDAKSLTLYGVYMPRNNPNACFVTGANKLRDIFDIPSAPPDSPRSDVDEASSPMTPRRPTTAPGYGRRPTPASANQPKQAWGEGDNHVDKADGRVYEQLIFWPTGLSVKGKSLGVNLKRTNSMPRLDAKLPSVQGVSVDRMQRSHDPVEETSLINQPPPSPMATSAKDSGVEKTFNIQQEKPKQADGPKKEVPLKKPKPILVDRSVNVPSVSGESIHWNEEPFMKVSACAVPQAKSASDSGSGKAVSFQKEENDKKEPEVSHNLQQDLQQEVEENTAKTEREDTSTKEVEIEMPSITDGASAEARVASSAQVSDPLPTTPQGNDLTIDSLSNSSQENAQRQENSPIVIPAQEESFVDIIPVEDNPTQENSSSVIGYQENEHIRESCSSGIDTSQTHSAPLREQEVTQETDTTENTLLENETAQENSPRVNEDQSNVAFFITEDDGSKKKPDEKDDLLNPMTEVSIQGELEPTTGQADRMEIPQVTIEEASVSGESEGASGVETVENSAIDDNVPSNNITEEEQPEEAVESQETE